MEEIFSTRLVIAFLVLTTLSLSASSSVYSCPSVCTCYVDQHGFRTANCTDVKFLLEHKFNRVIREIEVLNVEPDSDDHLILWDDMFSPFTKLKILNLSKCKINYLPKNVFKGLKKIYEINLSYNDLRHFDNAVFENSYTLYKLNLRGNPLQATYKPFISSPSLRDLDLGYCSMTVLQNEFFHGVKKVSRLHLDGNHLQTIKEHVLPRGIIHLNLASNRIVNVPISTIFSLNQLRWINLSANPINCTCPLLNLQDRLSGRGIFVEGDVRCAYPLELENISWSKINENELCNKEMFRSRLHMKKSQNAKYIYAQRKDNYFENEKYSQFENFQGDDPRKSGDEDYDTLMSEEGYAEPNNGSPTDDDGNRNEQHTSLKLHENNEKKETDLEEKKDNHIADKTSLPTEANEAKTQTVSETSSLDDISPKFHSEAETHGSGITNHKKLEEQISSAEENHESELKALSSTNEKDENKSYAGEIHDQLLADGAAEDEEDPTAIPMTTDADMIINDPEINGKSNLDNLDEGLKREDEILPVSESPRNEPAEADNTKSSGNENENKDKEDFNVPELENENKNDTSKSDVELTEKTDDIELLVVAKNVSEYHSVHSNNLEESTNTKDNKNSNAETTQLSETENKGEENLLIDNESNISYPEKESSIPLSSTTAEVPVISNTEKPLTPSESEGSGGDSINIPDESISVSIVDETAKEPTDIPSSEIPIIVDPNGSAETDASGAVDTNESSPAAVADDSTITYEAVGPYIVVVSIIILISVLILVSIYKGLCKSNKNNGKPVADVEASNGTELQDMKSLLPKTPISDEKHNNKYPNEVPSPETVNLIKDEKTDDVHEPNGLHDLNQNDSKNEPVVKNGKTPEGSPPPVEITKAKLTVLLESIPRTPIFVQKRPANINNG